MNITLVILYLPSQNLTSPSHLPDMVVVTIEVYRAHRGLMAVYLASAHARQPHFREGKVYV